jgi:hypothetical protein
VKNIAFQVVSVTMLVWSLSVKADFISCFFQESQTQQSIAMGIFNQIPAKNYQEAITIVLNTPVWSKPYFDFVYAWYSTSSDRASWLWILSAAVVMIKPCDAALPWMIFP